MQNLDNDYVKFNNLISNNLRSQRLAQKLSQGELAESIKVSTQQVAKYEQGVNRISAVRLALASKALNVPVETFFQSCDRMPCDLSLKHEARFLKIAKSFVEVTDRYQQDALYKLVKAMVAVKHMRSV